MLNPGIVFLDRVVEEPPGGGNLVLEVRELALQLLKVLVGFEIRVGLAQREELPERPGQCILGSGLRRDVSGRGGNRRIARPHHGFERTPLVSSIALHRLDQVGNEIVALLGLHVDVGEGLVDPLAQCNKPVVNHHDPERDQDDHAEDDPGDCGRGHGRLLAGEFARRGSLRLVAARLRHTETIVSV